MYEGNASQDELPEKAFLLALKNRLKKWGLLIKPEESRFPVLRLIVLMWDLGLQGECPPWENFWGILVRIYASFGENNGKHRTAKSTSAIED